MDAEIYKLALEVLSDAIKILGPALITGLVAYKLGRLQSVFKLEEIKKGNEFKAREKIFNYHLKKLDENTESIQSLSNDLATMAGLASENEEDESNTTRFVNGHLNSHLTNLPFALNHILKEIEPFSSETPEEVARLNEISRILKSMKVGVSSEEKIDLINELLSIYVFLGHCIRTIIEKEALIVFKPYTEGA